MSKYPILFKSNETEFKTHGIGVLSDAVQCDVTEQLNGIFELNMIYPSNGTYLKEFKNSRIIYADASRELGSQPFRICRITKMLNGLINVYAQHISYDLCGIQLPPFKTLGTIDGFEKIKRYSTTQNDYSFSTTVFSDPDNTFITETPKSVRAYLLSEKDSFLQAYGGEFTFDLFSVNHSTLRGSDKGFRVKYGVNLVDLNQEDSIEKMYTGIYPYYKDTNLFMDLTESYNPNNLHDIDTSKLSKKIMHAFGAFEKIKIANADLSSLFESPPTSSNDLIEVAQKYMSDNKIGIPSVSIDVRFEPLRKSAEYSNVIFLEDVFLGDTIHVDFVKLGVSAIGRINTIVYDSLRHKNKSVSIGDPKSNVADTVLSITKNKIPTNTSDLKNDSKFATEEFVDEAIKGAQLGGDDSEIDLSDYAKKDEIIVSLEQTTISNESGGTNIWTATFGDGSKSTIEVKNGEKGDPAPPVDTSQFYTKEQVEELIQSEIGKLDIPTNTSDLKNDSGYVTESTVQNLIDKALGNEGGDDGGGEGDEGEEGGGDTTREPEIDAIYSSETPFTSKVGDITACSVENKQQDINDALYIPLHITTYYKIQYVQINLAPEYIGTYNMYAMDSENNLLLGSWESMENTHTRTFTPRGDAEYNDIYIYGEFVYDADGMTYGAFPIQGIEIKA
jgi:phage minor structural protein